MVGKGKMWQQGYDWTAKAQTVGGCAIQKAKTQHAEANTHGVRLQKSAEDGESETARWKVPLASGHHRSSQMRLPPMDSPTMVTHDLSPPKAWMLSWIHFRAATMSRSSRFVGTSLPVHGAKDALTEVDHADDDTLRRGQSGPRA